MISNTMKKAYLMYSAILVLLLASFSNAQGKTETERVKVSAALDTKAVQPGQQATIAVVLDIREGFHAQSHEPLDPNLIKCEVKLNDDKAVKASNPKYPPGVEKTYPALGKLSVYEGKTTIHIPIEIKKDAAMGALKLSGTVSYQICDDKACFPPEDKEFKLETKIVPAGQKLEQNPEGVIQEFAPNSSGDVAPPTAKKAEPLILLGYEIGNESYGLIFTGAFLCGIIFNIMPCVLPVVPLKAIGFYKVAEENRIKSIAFGAVFSAGIVFVFALLGYFVVIARRFAWGELFTNQWFLVAIIILLTVFAFSMFGTFTVNLPTSVYRFTPRHDTYSGNFLFGILTAVLSTPCTFGMFVNLVIWAITQPSTVGLTLMMMVGFGMGFPYLILSAFPELARKMPRTGPWSELVKQMMGFLLLASAVYFAQGFIEAWVNNKTYWWSLFAIIAAAGVFLIVRTIQLSSSTTGRLVAAALALILVAPAGAFVYGITNPLFEFIPYSEAALSEARAKNQMVMVEFTANWCTTCRVLEATVFRDKRAANAIREHQVLTLRADITNNNAPGHILLRKLNPVGAIPFTAIYAPHQDAPSNLAGLYTTDNLIETISNAANSNKVATR
jgi:thiol:disulfide interchange protein